MLNDERASRKLTPFALPVLGGSGNGKSLRIRQFPQGEEVIATWQPESLPEAFPGVLSGGIIGTLLDCHCNWTAAYHLMKRFRSTIRPCTVTADYTIKLLRPTPTDKPIQLVARVVESTDNPAVVEGELIAHDKVTATCRGTFVAVKPGHPAAIAGKSTISACWRRVP